VIYVSKPAHNGKEGPEAPQSEQAAEQTSAQMKAEPEKELKDRSAELLDSLQRLQAEFENYRKRTEKEKEEYRSFANLQLLTQFLPVLDNFELALSHAKGCDEQLVKGMELVYAQLIEVLETNHVKPIVPNGVFDPYRHEAILTEAKEGITKNTILEVLQKGYEVEGRVLRTAKVKVAK
jgi:molecular chaperone GrpE